MRQTKKIVTSLIPELCQKHGLDEVAFTALFTTERIGTADTARRLYRGEMGSAQNMLLIARDVFHIKADDIFRVEQ